MADDRQFCTFFLGDRFFGVEVEKVQEVIRYQVDDPGAAGSAGHSRPDQLARPDCHR
jgi:hypothetical protein